VATILIVCILAFKVNILGSYLLIFLLALFGCALFLNIGFIIAGLVKSTKGSGGHSYGGYYADALR